MNNSEAMSKGLKRKCSQTVWNLFLWHKVMHSNGPIPKFDRKKLRTLLGYKNHEQENT